MAHGSWKKYIDGGISETVLSVVNERVSAVLLFPWSFVLESMRVTQNKENLDQC